MKRSRALAFPCSFVLILGIISLNIALTHAQPSVSFRLEQVAWGTSTANPAEVEPGDTNAPLTVDVRNLSNETLKGVYGTLQLNQTGPFIDYVTGTFNTTATGVPLQAGDIFNQTGEIQPAGSFALTFRLNIIRNATPGYYSYPLLIEYLVKSNSTWLQGKPKTLQITILLPNRPPTIDAFTPSAVAVAVQVGSSLNFSVKCSDPDNDAINYEWKLDAGLVSNTTKYFYAPSDQDVGVHTLILTTSDGRLASSQTWTITVTAVSVSHFLVSSNYITAGFDNQLNVTIRNNLWTGTVEVSLAIPQPFIIRGNQSWTFESMEPSRNLSITPRIYAPAAAIGSTSSGALTVSYSDVHGQAYTDTYNVGLVVQGYVKLVVYDLVLNPQPVANGSEVSITATVLNTGNVIANYANASLQSTPILGLSRESSTYVGDIELNSPVPFTIVAKVKSDVQNGTYPLTISLVYEDDQYRQHVLNVTAHIMVATGTTPPPSSDGTSGILLFLSNGGWTILVIVAAGIILLVLYVRRLSRAKQMTKSA